MRTHLKAIQGDIVSFVHLRVDAEGVERSSYEFSVRTTFEHVFGDKDRVVGVAEILHESETRAQGRKEREGKVSSRGESRGLSFRGGKDERERLFLHQISDARRGLR